MGVCVGLLEGVFEVVYIICRPPITLVYTIQPQNFQTRSSWDDLVAVARQ